MRTPRAAQWLWLLALSGASAMAAEETTLLGCRSVESDSARLACYDAIVDRLRAAPETRAEAAAEPPPSSDPVEEKGLRERLFGRPSSETLREVYGAEPPSEIVSTVAEARRSSDRLFVITLDNGQVWKQAEYASFLVRDGDAIEIEAGALGAFYLRRSGQGQTIRVKRLR